jgi:NAD(P)H dehydrogenase (quinone)
MFAVAGVSGHTGSVVADTLLQSGQKVRVLVRDAQKGEKWRQRGAEVAVVDLGDTAALTKACTGVAGAFVLLPPRLQSATPVEDNHAVTRSIAAASKAAGVRHLVLLSSIGAQHDHGTGPIKTLHDAERQFAATGVALTAVRAAYFMENWAMVLGTVAQGKLPTFLPTERPLPMVATRDIGKTAAAALVEGGKGAQVIELSGPRDYTVAAVAHAIGKLAGKQVVAEVLSLDAVIPTFTKLGASAAAAALFREMYDGIIKNKVAWEGGQARQVRGTVPLEDVLRPLLGS